MAKPTLTPSSTLSKSVLPATGDNDSVKAALPYGVYADSINFLNGASDQVAYVYKKLGGDVLDIEITEGNVYAAYEEAVLEYSYLVNIHQAKNSLGDLLGATTASFNEDGEVSTGPEGVALKYPQFTFSYTSRAGDGIAQEALLDGNQHVYSASFTTTNGRQDYDLQSVVYSASIDSENSGYPYYGEVGKKKITVREVYYKTARAMWRFFAYYGGLNVIGNMSSYGQYADDSTFQVVPTWQNKLQAINYEDSINTRISHYSYQIHNNKLRIFPTPGPFFPLKFWFKFTVKEDPWDEASDRRNGAAGVNNMNTLPFANIPYENINSIGKQWIRRFALALCKEVLGQIRGKFGGVPIPGDNITLNASDLLGQAKAEQDALRDELKTILDELTYAKLAERDASIAENATKIQEKIPVPIYVG